MCASFLHNVAPLLLGSCCLICGCPAMACCQSCQERISAREPHRVRRPGLQVPAWAANSYRPELARLIPAFKDDGAWTLAQSLSRRLAVAVAACHPPAGTVLTPVPSRPAAVRHRGIDHAWVLARLAARELGTTAVRLLRRRDSGQAQRSQDRTGRERLSQNRFLARPYRAPVIVVDDVVTTGTSLLVSCEALRRSGITVVAVAVIGDANLARKP